MTVESATYVSQLVSDNPKGSDQRSNGDDHLRLIKKTLGNTFPTLNGEFTDYYFKSVKDSAFGAVGDGVTDDTTALQAAFTWASANNGSLFIPRGTYLYSGELSITDTCTIWGEGEGITFFTPAASYTGWFLTIDDCWRNTGESVSTSTITVSGWKARVSIGGFTVLGNRLVHSSGCNGIRTNKIVDDLRMTNVLIHSLPGEGLALGKYGTNGVMRESSFWNVKIRDCGDSTYDAVIIDTASGAGDGTNNISFWGCDFVYNHGRLKITNSNTTHSTRRILFHGCQLHGCKGHTTGTGHTNLTDVVQLKGVVNDIRFVNTKANGSTTGKFLFAFDHDGDTSRRPTNVYIHLNVLTCDGGVFDINKVGGIIIDGIFNGNEITEDFIDAAASSIDAKVEVRSYIGGSITNTIDSTVDQLIVKGSGEKFAYNFESGMVQFGAGGTIPKIYHGTDSPESAVTADIASLYLRYSGSGLASGGRQAYIKVSGSGNTGWLHLRHAGGNSTANRPASPDDYEMYFDTTLGKPIWYNGSSWVDSDGSAT